MLLINCPRSSIMSVRVFFSKLLLHFRLYLSLSFPFFSTLSFSFCFSFFFYSFFFPSVCFAIYIFYIFHLILSNFTFILTFHFLIFSCSFIYCFYTLYPFLFFIHPFYPFIHFSLMTFINACVLIIICTHILQNILIHVILETQTFD